MERSLCAGPFRGGVVGGIGFSDEFAVESNVSLLQF